MIQFPYNPGGHAPYAKPAMRHLVKLPFLALVDGSADLMVGDIHQEIDGRFEHVRDFGRVGFGRVGSGRAGPGLVGLGRARGNAILFRNESAVSR